MSPPLTPREQPHPPAALPLPAAGTTLGPYRLLKLLGEGGMGSVFLAEHQHLKQRVAIKVLHPRSATDPGCVERFLREARTANRIRDPHIVRILEVGSGSESEPYVVMEHIEGANLYALWEEPAGLRLPRFFDVMLQVCDGLAAAHRENVVHRDIKPVNVYLTEQAGDGDFVKIVDFGLGKRIARHGAPATVAPAPAAAASEDFLTRTGDIVATPAYMSPEQAMGNAIDGRADLYALGVTMWELLVGRRPFVGASFGDYVIAHTSRPVPVPSQAGQSRVQGELPALLDAIVVRCMAKAPGDRYASAEALRDALEQAAGKGTTGAKTATLRARRPLSGRYGIAAVAALGGFIAGLAVPRERGHVPAAIAPAALAPAPIMAPPLPPSAPLHPEAAVATPARATLQTPALPKAPPRSIQAPRLHSSHKPARGEPKETLLKDPFAAPNPSGKTFGRP